MTGASGVSVSDAFASFPEGFADDDPRRRGAGPGDSELAGSDSVAASAESSPSKPAKPDTTAVAAANEAKQPNANPKANPKANAAAAAKGPPTLTGDQDDNGSDPPSEESSSSAGSGDDDDDEEPEYEFVEGWDPNHELFYYFNVRTQASQWVKPPPGTFKPYNPEEFESTEDDGSGSEDGGESDDAGSATGSEGSAVSR
jgi:hypothetical protein